MTSEDETSERDISIWVEALGDVMFCVPPKVRHEVLRRLTDREAQRRERPIRFMTAADFDPAKFKNWHAENEAASLIIQVLVRSIANSHSSADAARVLFREHRMGTGSGWLPDYLDGLPGLVVDLKRCQAISDSNGKSKLTPRDNSKHRDMGTSGHPIG
jgi:hypothetical protein